MKSTFWISILGVAFFVGLWWLVALALGPARLPTPLAQVRAIVELVTYSPVLASQPRSSGTIFNDLLATTTRCLVGIFVGCILGLVLGLVLGAFRALRDFIELPLDALRMIPPLAIAPFFLMWFGPSIETQMGTLIVFGFLRVVVNAVEAQRNIAPQLQQYAMTMGATRGQMFRTIAAPAILPEMAGAFRVALAASWGLQIVAELLGTPSGVGRVLNYLIPLLRPDLIIAVIFWVTVVAVAIDYLVFRHGIARLTRWVPKAAS